MTQPIEYIPRTRELYAGHEPYRWVHSDTLPPFMPISEHERDLADSTVMLVSSSGMFVGATRNRSR